MWRILAEVKTEFGKFSDQLEKVDDRLDKARNELDKLRNTRTNVMNRKLRDVDTLEVGEAPPVLELTAGPVDDAAGSEERDD